VYGPFDRAVLLIIDALYAVIVAAIVWKGLCMHLKSARGSETSISWLGLLVLQPIIAHMLGRAIFYL